MSPRIQGRSISRSIASPRSNNHGVFFHSRNEEASTFSVLFEVFPKSDQWDNHLGNAKMLRPELEVMSEFVLLAQPPTRLIGDFSSRL